jgi:hypothetical protein
MTITLRTLSITFKTQDGGIGALTCNLPPDFELIIDLPASSAREHEERAAPRRLDQRPPRAKAARKGAR